VGDLREGGAFIAGLDGYVDDFRFYNQALTAAEVARLAGGSFCESDGLTWATAFRYLRCAFAVGVTGSGDQVWVADGVYKPATTPFIAFQPPSGVTVMGGFTGSESAANQRPAFDPANPLTTLSGDIAGNDNLNTLANFGDNTVHLFAVSSGASMALSELRLQSGNATGAANTLAQNGGAILANTGSSVTLTNTVVRANKASGDGGAIFSQGSLFLHSSLFFSNTAGSDGGAVGFARILSVHASQFLSNTAPSGGAIVQSNLDAGSAVTITASLFRNNVATNFFGGALDVQAPYRITSSTFEANRAGFSGGAIEARFPATGTVEFSTFLRNTATTFSGGAIESAAPLTISLSIFLTNTAGFSGGAVRQGSFFGAPVTVIASLFRGNRATGGNCLPACSDGAGGAIHSVFSPVIVDASTFDNNFARLRGGALFSGAGLTVTNSSLLNNRAGQSGDANNPGHGGAAAGAGLMRISTTGIQSSTATGTGGAIVFSGTLQITNAGIVSATAGGSGGAILLEGGEFAFTGASFSRNRSAGAGGAMMALNATGAITGGLWSENQAQLSGGCLRMTGARLVINSAIFQDCTALSFGGAIHSNVRLYLSDVQLVRSSANDLGGALLTEFALTGGSEAVIARSVLTGNIVLGFGGAIYSAVPLTVSDTLLAQNQASNGGGAISADERIRLERNDFLDNRVVSPAGAGGGALYLLSGSLFSQQNLYQNNRSATKGGAWFLLGGASGRNDIFGGNSAGAGGGAISAEQPVTVSHSAFYTNTGASAGAIALAGSNGGRNLVHHNVFGANVVSGTAQFSAANLAAIGVTVTLVNNTMAEEPFLQHVAVAALTSTLFITNNVCYNYVACFPFPAASLAVIADYNFVTQGIPGVPGPHDLTGDPLLTNIPARDFRPLPFSPLIDAGLDSALPSGVTTDFLGQARPIDGPPDKPGAVDIGALEDFRILRATLAGSLAVNEGAALPLVAANVTGTNPIVAFRWDCNSDGAFEQITVQPSGASCTYPDNGARTLRLVVEDSLGITIVRTAGVTVNNVAPVVSGLVAQSAIAGQATSFALGSFTDPGADAPWQVTIHWGDATTTGPVNDGDGGGVSNQSHTFATAGVFTVTVTVRDKDNAGGSASFAVAVAPVPVAVNDSATTGFNASVLLAVMQNDTAFGGGTLQAVSDPAHGATVIEDGQVRYTPDSGFSGVDGFTYTFRDANQLTATGTVTVTVSPAPPPNAVNDSAETELNTLVAIDVTANDSASGGLTLLSVSDPAHGSAAIVAGQIQYTPDPGFAGIDTFTYVIRDGQNVTDIGSVTVTVLAAPPPNAVDDSAETDQNSVVVIDVTANDSASGGLTLLSVSDPAHGNAAIVAGQIQYTPDPGFAGIDTFTYVIRDGQNVTDTGTITVTVTHPAAQVEHTLFLPLVEQ
jgi:predicted outer membrane repeat protein